MRELETHDTARAGNARNLNVSILEFPILVGIGVRKWAIAGVDGWH